MDFQSDVSRARLRIFHLDEPRANFYLWFSTWPFTLSDDIYLVMSTKDEEFHIVKRVSRDLCKISEFFFIVPGDGIINHYAWKRRSRERYSSEKRCVRDKIWEPFFSCSAIALDIADFCTPRFPSHAQIFTPIFLRTSSVKRMTIN